jgi:hypothetical protein
MLVQRNAVKPSSADESAALAGKLRSVAEMPATAHHCQVHAEQAAIVNRGDDVYVAILVALDVLLSCTCRKDWIWSR